MSLNIPLSSMGSVNFSKLIWHWHTQSIAKIYNMALSPPTTEIPNSSRLSHELSAALVLDAFFLHALLRHKDTRQELLVLPHDGLQKFRFIQAMDERNLFMAGTGEEIVMPESRYNFYLDDCH
ncbi:hypothetical protein B0H19DRAFT_1333904 [Mycena capillaripes]|nr:hypothetical protein B0H19DRAFT_1333904 [Mycena capillaripes]